MSLFKRHKPTKAKPPYVEPWYRVSFSNVYAVPHLRSQSQWRGVLVQASCLATGSNRRYKVLPPESGELSPELLTLATKSTSVLVSQSAINPVMTMFADCAILESDRPAYDALTAKTVAALLEVIAPAVAKQEESARSTQARVDDAHARQLAAVKEKYGLA